MIRVHLVPPPPCSLLHLDAPSVCSSSKVDSFPLQGPCMGSPSCGGSSFPQRPPRLHPVHPSNHVLCDAIPDPTHTRPSISSTWHAAGHGATLDNYLPNERVSEKRCRLSQLEIMACGFLVPCHPVLLLGTMNLVTATVAAACAEVQGASSLLPDSLSQPQPCLSWPRGFGDQSHSQAGHGQRRMDHHSHSWEQRKKPPEPRANQSKGGGAQDSPEGNPMLLAWGFRPPSPSTHHSPIHCYS